MSNNQLHGLVFEQHILGAFPGACQQSNTDQWDVLASCDSIHNIPTSIKTTKNSTVDLADARRFWKIDHQYRMLVGHYDQIRSVKHVHTLYEFIISPETHQQLLGTLTYAEVEDFHNQILNSTRPVGKVRTLGEILVLRTSGKSCVTLNPKIGSRGQRRVQCSISLSDLIRICKPSIYKDTEMYRGINISLQIESSQRWSN